MDKREEFKKLLDNLHEWCIKYNEDYAYLGIAGGIGIANISIEKPDRLDVNIVEEYGRRANEQTQKQNHQSR